MKTLFFISASLIFFLTASAQKCRFTIDKLDDFSGEKINSIVHTNSGWTWVSSKKGSKYLIEMTFLQAGDIKKSMTTSDSILIKFSDGTVLHLHPIAEVAPTGGAVSVSSTSSSGTRYSTGTVKTSTTSVSSFSPTFEVDRAVYEKLSRSLMTTIRIDFTGKPYDLDFTKRPLNKSAPNLMNDAKCILLLN
jgi:hypothetical protein